MADSKAYTPVELQGHRVGITRPSPDYLVTVTDIETGLVVNNVTSFLLTWDGTTLQASVLLDGKSIEVPVHHVFTVTDAAVEGEEELPQSKSAGGVIQPGTWATVGGDSTHAELLTAPPGTHFYIDGKELTPPAQQGKQTPTSVPVVPVSVSSPASEVVSELITSSEATAGVPLQEHNGDTEPELPAITPEQEVQ